MSTVGSFDRTKHLEELASPLDTATGVLSPARRRGTAMRNLAGGSPPVFPGPAAASYATVGAQTYTAADILGGIIVRDCAGASRTDVLPTAALLVAAMAGATVGDVVRCLIVNGSDPVSEIITLAAGTGGGFDTNQTAVSRTILGTCSKEIAIRLTNVTAGAEAYVVYA